MRIFDNPNHPQYGPVRRMWIMLVQLDLLDQVEAGVAFRDEPWDERLARLAQTQGERSAQRGILSDALQETFR